MSNPLNMPKDESSTLLSNISTSMSEHFDLGSSTSVSEHFDLGSSTSVSEHFDLGVRTGQVFGLLRYRERLEPAAWSSLAGPFWAVSFGPLLGQLGQCLPVSTGSLAIRQRSKKTAAKLSPKPNCASGLVFRRIEPWVTGYVRALVAPLASGRFGFGSLV